MERSTISLRAHLASEGLIDPILDDVVGGDHGNPDEAPEHWRERSAYFNIGRIKTPLLILLGGSRLQRADQYGRRVFRAGEGEGQADRVLSLMTTSPRVVPLATRRLEGRDTPGRGALREIGRSVTAVVAARRRAPTHDRSTSLYFLPLLPDAAHSLFLLPSRSVV